MVKRNLIIHSFCDTFLFSLWFLLWPMDCLQVCCFISKIFGDFPDIFYFKCNSILVREHNLYDFNFLKYMETCFMVQHIVYLGVSSICRGKECVFPCCWWRRLIVLFGLSICFVYLLHQLLRGGNKISYHDRRFVYFFLLFYHFCFLYFEALLLGAYTFRILTSSNELAFSIIIKGPSLSLEIFILKSRLNNLPLALKENKLTKYICPCSSIDSFKVKDILWGFFHSLSWNITYLNT